MKKIFLILSVICLLLLVSCVPENKTCSIDSDCVPSTCCHPRDAVNIQNSPDCAGILCSMECDSGSIDCGQGKISCVDGSCEAVFN